MKKDIIKLLNKYNINYREESMEYSNGTRFIFNLVGSTYNLFTSCWKDYGLHFVYYTNKGRKEHQCKIIDYEQNLDRIEQIIKPIIEWNNNRK